MTIFLTGTRDWGSTSAVRPMRALRRQLHPDLLLSAAPAHISKQLVFRNPGAETPNAGRRHQNH